MILKERIDLGKLKKKDYINIALRYIAFFVLGFVLSLGKVINDFHPFGVSLIIASKKKYFIPSALGAVIGYIIFGFDVYSARYLVAAVMAVIGAFAASAFELNYRPYFAMTVSFLSIFSTGVVLNFHLGSENIQYALAAGEAVLACGGTYFFYRCINSNYKRLRFRALPLSEVTCIVITASIILMNLSQIYIGKVCLARAAAMTLIMIAIRFGNDRLGIILALSFGFAFGIAQNGSLFLIGAFAFSAMLANLFSSMSILGIGFSFLCSIGFFSIAANSDISLSLFIEGVISILIFILMPSKLCRKIENYLSSGKDAAPDGSLRQSLVLKLRFAASAMAAISDSVDQVREKINVINRRENDLIKESISAEEYIRREIILEKTNQIRMVASDQFFSISGMLEDLAFEFDEAEIFNSKVSAKIRRLLGEFEIYPKNISAIEDKFGRMRVEILTDSSVEKLENPKLRGEIGKICSRYFEKGKITNFKDETMLSFFERPNYSLSVGFTQHSAGGKLCGDTVKIINDNKGHCILIISDGMGKGSRAALDGAMGAGLLSKLLNAGFGFDSALKVVNSALLVKSNDESLATLDVANIDLFTGKCEMFKAGAPASFIMKSNGITKCELTSMPAGILRGIEFAKRTAVLRVEDKVVLMSDGITDLGENWLNKTLALTKDFSPQECADFILESALKECTGEKMDDMSIICARLERN